MAIIPYLLKDTLDDLSVVFGTKPGSRSLDSLLRNIKKTDQLTDQSADQFFKVIYDSIENRYRTRSRKRLPSVHNWRFSKELKVRNSNPSPETRLEKCIAELSGENWANAIPTASGLFDSGGRKANIDLAVKHKEFISFIELKWDSNSSLYAGFELMGYAMAWLQARLHATEMGYISKAILRPALDTDHCQWVVLAPPDYYHATDEQFLKHVENWFSQGLKGFFKSFSLDVSTGFKFVSLPEPCPNFRIETRLPESFLDALEEKLCQRN